MYQPTPHGDKLRALTENSKLPDGDRPRIHEALERYKAWIAEMERIDGSGDQLIEPLTESLNRYKYYIDVDLVFDSEHDFLYRQKGQLKLDNTVLEEFLPWLVGRVFADSLSELGLAVGPTNAFSQLHFDSNLLAVAAGGGMAVRSKDHDFALARPLFIKTSHHDDFSNPRETRTHLAYVAAEIKTNLDKTMFQEASATAYDLKLVLPNSRYFLLCEWLDMTPISTAVTAIEEVIVLRRAKRMASDIRSRFATADGRSTNREILKRHLSEHCFVPDAFRRFVSHLEKLLKDADEHDILSRGWF